MQINLNELQNEKAQYNGKIYENEGKILLNENVNFSEGVFSSGALFSDNTENSSKVTYDKKSDAASQKGVQNISGKEAVTEALTKLDEMITPDGYSKMEELGLSVNNEDVNAAVTIDERIQIMLATYCDDYTIMGTGISSDEIKAVLGKNISSSQAESSMNKAVYMAEDIQKMSELAGNTDAKGNTLLSQDAKKYLINNNMEPTIKNTYMAVHSGVGKTAGTSISEEQWLQIEPQVKSVYEHAGLTYDKEAATEGRWMVENGIAVTEDAVILADKINDLNLNMNMGQIKETIVNNLSVGIVPEDTVLLQSGDVVSNANIAVDTLNKTSTEDLNYIVKNNNKLTIDSLREAQLAQKKYEISEYMTNDNQPEAKIAHAERVVAEARLVMTTASCIQIQKLGININTMELSSLTEALKTAENKYYEAFFATENMSVTAENTDLLKASMTAVNVISVNYTYYSAEFIGKASVAKATTINSLSLIQMESVYAGVGTEVRGDLGDRIEKAFANADSLLETLGFDITDENRKAARILGYNSIEINAENMTEIKNLSKQIENLMTNFTPRAAVKLIKDGVNPLNADISVLNEKLVQINEYLNEEAEPGNPEEEKYSKFLWRLDKSGELTEEERKAYISMYRLLTWVNRNDGNVVGALYNEGKEVNLKNLLSAARTKKLKGIDVTLDDRFGLTEEINKPDDIQRNIEAAMGSQDIVEYTEKLLKESEKMLNSDGCREVFGQPEPGLVTAKELHTIMSDQNDSTNNPNEGYAAEQIEKIRQMGTVSEDAINSLLDGNITPTINNLLASEYILGKTGNVYGRIKDMLKTAKKSDSLQDMEDAVTDGEEEELQSSFEKLEREIYGEYKEAITNSFPDWQQYKTMELTKNIVSVMGKLSRNRQYVVDGYVDGENAVIRLSIKEGDDNNKVDISFESEKFGKIRVMLDIKDNAVSGKAAALSAEGQLAVSERIETLSRRLSALDVTVTEIVVAQMKDIRTDVNTKTDGNVSSGNNRLLYNMAKTVISVFR